MVLSRHTQTETLEHAPASPPVPGRLDRGIRKAVERLQTCGIETFESCEGGPGHAYPEPTIRFQGTPEAGWRALGICLAHGLPVASLRRIWDVLDIPVSRISADPPP
jgi:hypothetical protein